jgi:hypothetical protein
MDEAYSLDFEQIVDAEKAYDLFWSGIIKDKRNFECPDYKCSAKLTCANIDKPRYVMKKLPYFRLVGKHHPDCELSENKDGTIKVPDSRLGIGNKYIDSQTDIFLLDKPKKTAQSKSSDGDDKEATHIERKKRTYIQRSDNVTRQPEYNTIKPLVSKYEIYLSECTLDKHCICINKKGVNIQYGEMFKPVEGLDFNYINKYPRIYWGEATVFKISKSDAYSVTFKNTILKDGVELKGSIFLANSIINENYRKNIWLDMLSELAKSRQRAVFYIYSKPILNEQNSDYVKFPIINLNNLDFRVIEN